jgi:hypothetical protein
MPGPRPIVDPPTLVPRAYGLWSVVEDRSALLTDGHWRNGLLWEDLCGTGGTSYDDYCLETSPDAKAANVNRYKFGATPFVAFAEIDCSPVGYSQEENQALAQAALMKTEPYQVERAFWTGTAGGDANLVYPHLAAAAAVVDTTQVVTVNLQCATTTVTGSVVLDITEGLGRLEALLASCLAGGRGVIHMPYALGELAFRANAVYADGPQLKTRAGNLVALGAGYPGSGPDGTSVANAQWIYGTGPVFGYRSSPEQFAYRDSIDRSENTVKLIVERSYVLGFSCCCLYATLISLGGLVEGAPLSPT